MPPGSPQAHTDLEFSNELPGEGPDVDLDPGLALAPDVKES